MSGRNIAGVVVLCAMGLLVAALFLGCQRSAGEPIDPRERATFDAVGVRLPIADLLGSEGRTGEAGLAFGPESPRARSADPASRAFQALSEGRFDRAIRLFERALQDASDSPALGTALSAAYLARGLAARGDSEGERPADLVEALNRIGPEPTDLPSHFNRALALESLYCFRVAVQAWSSYLERDPGSEWAEIARARLAALSTRLAELERGPSPGPEADESSRSEANASDEKREAMGALDAGEEALAGFDLQRALDRFRRSRDLFTSAGDPRRWTAEMGIAHAEYHLQRHDRAAPRAHRVRRAARQLGDAALEARALFVLSNVHLSDLDLDRALRFSWERYELAHEAGLRTDEASAALTLSRVFDELGEPETAWLHRAVSFRAWAAAEDGERLARTVGNSSFALARQGRFRAAVDFASETVELDRALGRPVTRVDSLWIRASHRTRAGDGAGAIADVREAEAALDGFTDDAMRTRYYANLRAVEGEVLRADEPQRAVDSLSEALEHLRARSFEYGQTEILLARARALRRLGRLAEAARDLEEAGAMVELQRERIGGPLLRVSFFDLQGDLADESIALAVERGDVAAAFRIAESAKGKLLRESLGPPVEGAPAVASPERIVALREDEIMVSYWSLPDELLAWIVDAGAVVTLHRLPIPRRRLSAWAEETTEAFERGGAGFGTSPRLGDELLARAIPDAPSIRRLVIVPDRFTRGIPWASLEQARWGESLLDRFVVRTRPTALAAGRPFRPGGLGAEEVLLALGDPRSGGAAPPLPAARREVEEIAGLFDRATVLIGSEATRQRFREALGEASVVHVAGHFESGPRPWSTRIPLAAGEEAEPGLSVREIAGFDLGGVRLAVLGGCATQREGRVSLEGTYSAAGAFLAAGVGDVIATLWPVDDRTTAELMTELYPRLLRGADPAEALRETQLALRSRRATTRSGASADWAAFQVISLRPVVSPAVPREEEKR